MSQETIDSFGSDLESALSSDSPNTRWMRLIKKDFVPTRAQFDRGINDKDPGIRREWAAWVVPGLVPTAEQIEAGLTDINTKIRTTWTERMDFKPTKSQIDRGIVDDFLGVRCAWAERSDFVLDQGQIAIVIDDIYITSFLLFIKRPEVILDEVRLKRLHKIDEKLWPEKHILLRQMMSKIILLTKPGTFPLSVRKHRI